jgi:hypothetical protein
MTARESKTPEIKTKASKVANKIKNDPLSAKSKKTNTKQRSDSSLV